MPVVVGGEGQQGGAHAEEGGVLSGQQGGPPTCCEALELKQRPLQGVPRATKGVAPDVVVPAKARDH
eukprot:310479-Alexandrium_andersonii.AAC.2